MACSPCRRGRHADSRLPFLMNNYTQSPCRLSAGVVAVTNRRDLEAGGGQGQSGAPLPRYPSGGEGGIQEGALCGGTQRLPDRDREGRAQAVLLHPPSVPPGAGTLATVVPPKYLPRTTHTRAIMNIIAWSAPLEILTMKSHWRFPPLPV